MHALTLVLVVTFLWLGWWQLGRAASGNLLSYGYAIQWPAFAAFVIFVWYKEVKRALAASDQPESADARHDATETARPTATAEAGTGVTSPAAGGMSASGARGTAGATGTAGAGTKTVTGSAAGARRPPRESNPLYDDSDDPELAAYNRYLAWLNANPHANPADYPGQ